MKKFIFFLAFALPLSISAQKAPEAVTKAFTAKFPNVTKVSYDKEKTANMRQSSK